MHKPVLFEEVIEHLQLQSGCVYVDATLGRGGHALGILERTGSNTKLIGIDIDPFMLEKSSKRLQDYEERCSFVNNSYIHLGNILDELEISEVDGIVFDFGIATEHFTIAERGFSIMREGPLDMRLSSHGKLTAEKIVNSWRPEKLETILFRYGEERRARRIVSTIVKYRKEKVIKTTKELADIVCIGVGAKKNKNSKVPGYRIHPATKTFQALRIAVNDELNNIVNILEQVSSFLKNGSRVCAISFHSLEDRIVKNAFRDDSKLKIITKKPISASREEMMNNPRARSAKLRVAEKI